MLQSMGSQRGRHGLATKQQQSRSDSHGQEGQEELKGKQDCEKVWRVRKCHVLGK